jgi:hypothetical protein
MIQVCSSEVENALHQKELFNRGGLNYAEANLFFNDYLP